MLKKIDQSDIDKLDDAQRQNLMVNAEGDYVFAQADEKAWRKHLEQVKASEAAQKKVQVGNKELQDRGLECSIDKRLFVDPMKTPCCGKTYCHDCIENALLENDLTCPGCETENISLERLEPDEETKAKIKEYQAEKTNEKSRSRSPTVAGESPKPDNTPTKSQAGSQDGTMSPQSNNGHSRKRNASDVDGSVVSESLAAPAMKRQRSGDAVSASTPKADANTEKQSSSKDDTSSKDGATEKNSTNSSSNTLPENMMPPDMAQMMQSMNFPMMPNFNPFMMNPMAMNMGMNMGMGMNGMNMNNMNGMNSMNWMQPNNFNMPNGMNGMDSMFPNNMNFNGANNQGFGNQNQNWNMNMNMNMNQNQNQNQLNAPTGPRQNGYNNNRPHRNQNFNKGPPAQPTVVPGAPTGPKALQNQNQNHNQNFYPPTGPAENKFSNQQRHVGNEEDNAYMRQPVNPHRHVNRNRRARQADYREL